MDATVYSYTMTFKTLTFRDDPRFQDGLYILVVTELAENAVNRILYGPLTADIINRFREGYIQAAQDMLKAAAILLPRADTANLPPIEPLHIQLDLEPRLITDPPMPPLESVRIDNPWGIDTTGWSQTNKDTLAMWASVHRPANPGRPEGYFTNWETPDGNGLYWRYSDSGQEFWYVMKEKTDRGWRWYCDTRPSLIPLHDGKRNFDTAQAAADDCLQWHQEQGLGR